MNLLLPTFIEIEGRFFPKSFSQIDSTIFDFWKLDVLVFSEVTDTDEETENIKGLYQASNFFINTNMNSFCDGREIILTSKTIHVQENPRRYIKDPCSTIMVLWDEKSIHFQQEPYFYFFNGRNIIEVQSYNRQRVKLLTFEEDSSITYHVTDVFQRRKDLNGAPIVMNHLNLRSFFHVGDHGEMLGENGEIISMFKEKFNFSIQWYGGPQEYGIKSRNGKWNGYIGALIEGDLDVNTVNLGFVPDRVEVVSPGFPLAKHSTAVTYKRSSASMSKVWAIFQIFSNQLWIIIAVSLLTFSISIGKPQLFLKSICKVTKAMLGQVKQ